MPQDAPAFGHFRDVHQSFARAGQAPLVAIERISFDLAAGQLATLLGPSGCGKTTFLKIVAGLMAASGGTVQINGRDVTEPHPDFGIVFQQANLMPWRTVLNNVLFPMEIIGRRDTAAVARAGELLALVGLAGFEQSYPAQLSGGMQQRVALARAIAIEPKVLLLDEPLSALDAKVRVQLREEIRRIQLELGITTIYVTHDQEEALSISDRVAVMYGGKIEQVGSPAEMYGSPATPFVAEFIGTMNRLTATVSDDGAIDYEGLQLPVDAAQGLPRGERVLCLVRPETVDVAVADGAPPEGGLTGDVVSKIFLGAVTRVRVEDGDRNLVADLSTSRAAPLAVGTRVVASFPSSSPRLLALTEDAVPPVLDPDDP